MGEHKQSVVIDLTDGEDEEEGKDVIIVPVLKIVDLGGKAHPYYDDCGCQACEQHPLQVKQRNGYCECRKCKPRHPPIGWGKGK